VSGSEHPETLVAAHLLAENLIAQIRDSEAENLLKSMLEIQRRVAGDHHADTLWTVSDLGGLLIRQNRYDEAEELLVSSYRKGATGADSNRQFQCLIAATVDLYEQRDAAEPGKGYAEKAEEYRALLEAKPEDAPEK
jgi:hypothetical protein